MSLSDGWVSRAWWVCQAPGCHRPFIAGVHADEFDDWLFIIGHDDGRPPVVRCPRHITRWAYRTGGLPMTVERQHHAKWALWNDLHRYVGRVPGYDTPVPIPEEALGRFTFDP